MPGRSHRQGSEAGQRVQHGQRVLALNQQQYKERLDAEKKARLKDQETANGEES